MASQTFATTQPPSRPRKDITFPAEMRRALVQYACSACPATIQPGELYLRRLRRVGGQMVASKAHVCCPVPPAPGAYPSPVSVSLAPPKPDWLGRIIAAVFILGLLLAVVLAVVQMSGAN